MKTSLYSVFALVAFVLVSGCQKAPETELNAARAALTQADSVEADVYVSELYAAALDSFNEAQSEIEVEEAKSAFGRDYGHAAELLAFTEQTAHEAISQVEANKDAIRAEADSLIALAQTALTAQPAGTTSTVANSGMSSVAMLVNEAVQARDIGNYMSARDLARTAVDQLMLAPAQSETIIPRS